MLDAEEIQDAIAESADYRCPDCAWNSSKDDPPEEQERKIGNFEVVSGGFTTTSELYMACPWCGEEAMFSSCGPTADSTT